MEQGRPGPIAWVACCHGWQLGNAEVELRRRKRRGGSVCLKVYLILSFLWLFWYWDFLDCMWRYTRNLEIYWIEDSSWKERNWRDDKDIAISKQIIHTRANSPLLEGLRLNVEESTHDINWLINPKRFGRASISSIYSSLHSHLRYTSILITTALSTSEFQQGDLPNSSIKHISSTKTHSSIYI